MFVKMILVECYYLCEKSIFEILNIFHTYSGI